MKNIIPAKSLIASCAILTMVCAAEARPPNVLMFVLDDMNDWVGALGYKQAVTPNMDRLADMGVNFSNAHSAGIFCAPSRSAFFTGRHASTTGCYTTQVYFHNHPDITPLQKVLQEGGYATYGAGKLFHHPAGFVDLRGWDEFFVRDEGQKTRGWPLESWTLDDPALPQPYPNSIFNHDREPANKFFLEWGPVLDENEGRMADTIRTEWACDLLRKRHDKPFFVAVGLYTPHFPNYCPAKYFDLYNEEDIELPPYKADDLEDLPPKVRKAKEQRAAHHKRLERLGALKAAVHGYLACVSYADAMLGRLLDAVESGPNAGNTVVVFWSDHGYHHGEKFDWGKHTLWERTSNVPFMWAGPGIAQGGKVDATVSLVDVFPTLTELCGVNDALPRDGVSLAPVLNDPTAARDRNVLLPGMKPEEYAVINRDWRYIRYADGTEELYDVRSDPNEWDNLLAPHSSESDGGAGDPERSAVKRRLAAAAPQVFAEPGPRSADLKLVTEGTSFTWNARKKRVKPLPASVHGAAMAPRASDGEAQMAPVESAGRPAWTSAVRSGRPTYFYFNLKDPAFKHGNQPSVQVAITYLDRGNTTAVVQYDSDDPNVNKDHPHGTGVFKEAHRFPVGDSGKWKKAVFNLSDARFSSRCNGADLRVGFTGPGVDPVISRVLVKPLTFSEKKASGKEPMTVKAVTFNVRYPAPQDLGRKSWGLRKDLVVRTVRKHEPDFLGNQEIVAEYLPFLEAQLPEYAHIGRFRKGDGDRFDECSKIFYRKDRWEVVEGDEGSFQLSDTPEVVGSRDWTSMARVTSWGRFREKATGRTLYVYNTHWDHRTGRDESSLLCAERIAARKVPGDPVIFMGDFNQRQDQKSIRHLLGEHVFETPPPIAMADTDPEVKKIDHIFVMPPDTRVLEARVISDRFDVDDYQQVRPSDHDPTLAVLQFQGPDNENQ